jgi:hypothetical protein
MNKYSISILLCLLSVSLFGQQSTLKEGKVDLSEFPVIKLQVHDRNPSQLSEADFKILIDENEILPEVKPWGKSHLHGKTLLILVEVHYLKERRNQLDFFKNILQNSIHQLIGDDDRFALATFDWTRKENNNKVLRFETDTFNSNKEDLNKIIEQIKPGSNLGLKEKSAEILLALNESIELLSKFSGQGKTILLLSSEFSNIYNSSISVGDLAAAARLKDIAIYTLRNPVGMAEKYNLRQLATETFGTSETFQINEKDSASAYLKRLHDLIAERAAGNSYELSFSSGLEKDGSYNKLEIISKHGNLNIEFNAPKASIKEMFFQYLYYWIGFFGVILAGLTLILFYFRKQKKKRILRETELADQARMQKETLDDVKKIATNQEEELKKLKALNDSELLKGYLLKKQKEMLSYGPYPRLQNLQINLEHIIDHYEYKIGRESDNTLTLEDVSVSRHHATINFTEGNYFIEDQQSTNGTRLNGTLVGQSKMILSDQDKITIENLHFIFYR